MLFDDLKEYFWEDEVLFLRKKGSLLDLDVLRLMDGLFLDLIILLVIFACSEISGRFFIIALPLDFLLLYANSASIQTDWAAVDSVSSNSWTKPREPGFEILRHF